MGLGTFDSRNRKHAGGFAKPMDRLPRSCRFFLLCALFLSGANGLVLEIVFRRQLLLSLGVTHYSVGTVLTVFMAGLALGSLLFGYRADKIEYPIRLYGILEIGTGLAGLLLIWVVPYLDPLYAKLHLALATEGAANILLKSLLAGAVLLIPTTLMGGTLPVIGKAFSREGTAAGSPLGLIYGINTFGGVAGVIGATFFLLNIAGAMRTLAIVSGTTILVGLMTLVLFGKSVRIKKHRPDPDSTLPGAHLKPSRFSWSEKAPLAVFFISGFAALSLEVHWTRILAYVVGSHGYAFGIILAAFLCGIALGSTFVSRFADKVKYPLRWLGCSQLLVTLLTLAASSAMFKLRGLTGWLTLQAGGSWSGFIALEMLILFALLLLPTFCMGAVFPLVMTASVKVYARLGQSVGKAYMLNTVGSILGAFFAGFVFIPLLGISLGLKVTIFTSILGGTILFTQLPKGALPKIGISVLFLALGVMVVYSPVGYQLQHLRMGERLIFYDESSSATVSVREDEEGGRMLSVNGLDEVPVDPASLLTFRVLAHLPLMLHPNPEKAMVLALGGGVTTGSVARHPLETIDVVELCPPVAKAAELFEQWNYGVLDDARLRLVFQDGRNHLLTTQNRYDVITADATHPWSADSWILYTREMYRLVRSRLTDQGIFCQWIPLHWMSTDDFKCILRTLRTQFPHLSLWYTGSYVVAMGSPKPMVLDPVEINRRLRMEKVRADLGSVGIDSAASLLGLHLLSDTDIDRFVGQGPLNTDDFAYLEHSASRCFGRETTPENLTALMEARNPPELLPPSDSPETLDKSGKDLPRFFQAREKTIAGRIATYKGDFTESVAYYRSALELAPEDGVTQIFLTDVLGTMASAMANKGDDARRSGRIEDAVSIYRQALKLDASAPRAHNGLGLLFFAQNRYRKALTHFDIALERFSKQAQIRYNRTLALLKLGRIEEARGEIDIIEALEAGGPDIYTDRIRKIMAQL
jgi:spermidine synthase